MKKLIKIEIYHDGECYCARCIDYDIFTQGPTLDELVHNIKDAVSLHFEDDPSELEGYDRSPAIFSQVATFPPGKSPGGNILPSAFPVSLYVERSGCLPGTYLLMDHEALSIIDS